MNMLKNLLSVCLLAFLLQTIARIDEAATEPSEQTASSTGTNGSFLSCGPLSLYLLCRLEGMSVNLPTINGCVPKGGSAGHSMTEIREAASACGLGLSGARLRLRDWPIDRPALVFTKRGEHGHFLVIQPVGHSGKLVQVIDPNREPVVMDATELFASPEWTGIVLIPTDRRRIAHLSKIIGVGSASVLVLGGVLYVAGSDASPSPPFVCQRTNLSREWPTLGDRSPLLPRQLPILVRILPGKASSR